MDNTSLISLLQDVVNTIYYAMSQNRCIPDIENDLCQSAKDIERVITELENQNENE